MSMVTPLLSVQSSDRTYQVVGDHDSKHQAQSPPRQLMDLDERIQAIQQELGEATNDSYKMLCKKLALRCFCIPCEIVTSCFSMVYILCDPEDYPAFLRRLENHACCLTTIFGPHVLDRTIYYPRTVYYPDVLCGLDSPLDPEGTLSSGLCLPCYCCGYKYVGERVSLMKPDLLSELERLQPVILFSQRAKTLHEAMVKIVQGAHQKRSRSEESPPNVPPSVTALIMEYEFDVPIPQGQQVGEIEVNAVREERLEKNAKALKDICKKEGFKLPIGLLKA